MDVSTIVLLILLAFVTGTLIGLLLARPTPLH
jgi:uncharacterized protein YneF (UPF0154 family)